LALKQKRNSVRNRHARQNLPKLPAGLWVAASGSTA